MRLPRLDQAAEDGIRPDDIDEWLSWSGMSTGETHEPGGMIGRMGGAVATRVIELLDLNLLLDHVDIDRLVERIDISAVLDRVDVNGLMARLDVDHLLDLIDVNEFLNRVDINHLLDRVDVDGFLDQVDVNRLLDSVDVDQLLDRADVNRILDRVDVDDLMERINVDRVVERAGIPEIVAESTGRFADSTLDLFRSFAAGLDFIVYRSVQKLIGRNPDDLPTSPFGSLVP